jgi:proteic killer suppression protein
VRIAGGFCFAAGQFQFYLDAAQDIRTLSTLPGNRLERLRGDRKGQYSIRVNDQWRVCFEWRDGHAYEVEIVDYR